MLDASEIRRQVEEICSSPPLDIARRRRALLRYIVESTLAGKPATETSIAINVYEKDPNLFHPTLDAIARTETGKLRKGLENFYESNKGTAQIRIRISGYQAVAEYTDAYRPERKKRGSAGEPRKSKRKYVSPQKPVRYAECSVEDGYSVVLTEGGRLQLPPEHLKWILIQENRWSLKKEKTRFVWALSIIPDVVRIYNETELGRQLGIYRANKHEVFHGYEDWEYDLVHDSSFTEECGTIFRLPVSKDGKILIPPSLRLSARLDKAKVILWRPLRKPDSMSLRQHGYLALVRADGWEWNRAS